MVKNGGETTLKDCFDRGEWLLEDIRLTEKEVRINVAIIHDTGRAEPRIIAFSERPAEWRALDYGMRRGVEAVFSRAGSRRVTRPATASVSFWHDSELQYSAASSADRTGNW